MTLIGILAVLLLAVAIGQTRVANLKVAVHISVIQSVIVALACIAIGFQAGEVHMYIAAVLQLLVKVLLIPFALLRLLPLLHREREAINSNWATAFAFVSIVLSGGLLQYALPGMATGTLIAAVSLVLIGLVLIMTRHQALVQIIGLITMENGLYLIGLSITNGLPLIIELGIFFDLLVAVVVLVILTYMIKLQTASTDTSNLNELKG